jgi:ribonuclease BN (tRNA processing enzyme)
MFIQILGAHNIESRDYKCVSFLIDDSLAIEAGCLASSLSLAAQQKLKAILITHQHYDHIRDIPAIGINFRLHESNLEIFTTQPVYDILTTHILNDKVYPNYFEKPPEKPAFTFRLLEPDVTGKIGKYSVLPVSVNHSVPAVGYQITAESGKSMFYTADTGPGLADCWQKISPQLIIMECTAPDRYEEFARTSGHMTPGLVHQELETFRKLKGYLPQVILVHMNPLEEKEIEPQIKAVAKSLNATIRMGREGMRIQL